MWFVWASAHAPSQYFPVPLRPSGWAGPNFCRFAVLTLTLVHDGMAAVFRSVVLLCELRYRYIGLESGAKIVDNNDILNYNGLMWNAQYPRVKAPSTNDELFMNQRKPESRTNSGRFSPLLSL